MVVIPASMGRKRKMKGKPITGWVALDKPAGLTSTQALGRVRFLLDAAKAGHAGTLDPLATGCLPIALGAATKRVAWVQDQPKTYRFTVRWGTATDTDDAQGEVIATSDTRPCVEAISALLLKYTGAIMQIPPCFSALKIAGERAYNLARAGVPAVMEARPVEVYSFILLDAREDEADFEAITGKGTYVRSLARDMGVDLGCYGHITALRREAVGPFGSHNMISLDTLVEMSNSGDLGGAVLPLGLVLDDIPALAEDITTD